jgi:hypothetical protein
MTKIMPILTLVVGSGLGAWWGQQQVAPAVVARGVPAASGSTLTMQLSDRPQAVAWPASPDLSALRAMIREELASALAGKGRPAPVVAETASPELVAQRRDAQAQISALIAGSVWGDAQRINFRQKLGVLNAEQREQAMQELISGINSGAIKVDDAGPPL